MWILLALGSALFAGLTAVLAKIGIKNTDSNLATALRTVVVAVFAWLMVFVAGAQHGISEIDPKSLVFLMLSGVTTGASWLCYFRALQRGDVNQVVPIDKSSTILTMLLSIIFLQEPVTWLKCAAMVLIGVGTHLMIERKTAKAATDDGYGWMVYAVLSALFASLTAILGKIGISGVESNLGTAMRTMVVLVMAWVLVFVSGKQREIKQVDRRSWWFLGISGITTGLSWLCFYRALQDGPASVVVPVDKLSILVTIAFGRIVLQERLRKRAFVGLLCIVAGTLTLLI